jgi:CBS domain-containing protein
MVSGFREMHAKPCGNPATDSVVAPMEADRPPSTLYEAAAREEVPMKIRSVMSTKVVAISPEATLKDAAARMVRYGISGMPVVDEAGQLMGVLSEGDILAKESGSSMREGMLGWLMGDAQRARLEARTVAEAMSSPALSIGPERTVREAAARMLADEVNRLPVVEGGKLVGIVTRADLVRALARSDEEIRREIDTEVVRQILWLDPTGLDVGVEDGVVTLSGTLPSESDIELLREFVRRVPGVVSVRSALRPRETAYS